MNKPKKILICPLDWGLGHATRCMPLIAYLLEKGCEVIVAGNTVTNTLIRDEFPTLKYLEVRGYNVSYAASKYLLPIKMLAQIPKLLKVIRYEQIWLRQAIIQHQIDLVISDNRYGFYSDKVQSIFITHQLQIAVPQSAVLERIVNKINHRFIRKFTSVWVPDYEDHALAGKLSVAGNNFPPVNYLGSLSRFEIKLQTQKLYDIAVLLSGPEPQRTLLENIMLEQLKETHLKVMVVQGTPLLKARVSGNPQVSIVSHLSKTALELALLQSEIVICRSGYSTIMDLVKLNRHAILIPTPGQTEQEYLATYLATKKWFTHAFQSNFDLEKELHIYRTFRFDNFAGLNMEQYKNVIDEVL